MKNIQVTVKTEESFSFTIEGLTREETREFCEGLDFLNERLPNGLDRVSNHLLAELKLRLHNTQTKRFDIERNV